MKKETIIAIVFGLTLGLVVSIIMVFQTKSKTSTTVGKKEVGESSQIVTPLPQRGFVFQFELTSPSNYSIVDKKFISITGKTTKDSLIMIQSPIKDAVLKNTQESFSVDFPLALGENAITITVYPKDTQQKPQQKELYIYYMDTQEL